MEEEAVAAHRSHDPHQDPTAADLAAIEREWPLIAAELDLTDIQTCIWCAEGKTTELDRHRLRRAEQRLMREAVAYVAVHMRATAVAASPEGRAA